MRVTGVKTSGPLPQPWAWSSQISIGNCLRFAAEHKLVLASQAAVLLAIKEDTVARKLRALCAEGLLRSDRLFDSERPCFQATRAGLGAISSPLGPPKPADRDHLPPRCRSRLDLACGRRGLLGAARPGRLRAAHAIARWLRARRRRSHRIRTGTDRGG